ncbi:MAG: TadE/TadG family type IV pilus assembly protein [Microvirga sp.]
MLCLATWSTDRSGSISTSFALALIPILGMAGVAVDYTGAASARAHLQARTDAAALQVAKRAPTSEEAQKLAQVFLAGDADGFTNITATVSKGAVTVSATKQFKTQVVNILGFDEIPVRGRSTAAIQTDGAPICVLGLSHTASPAVSFSGNSSFAAKGCAVYSNSTAQNSLSIQGSAAAEADAFCAVGGASGTFNPAAKTPCATKDDPFVGLRRPVSVGCDYSSSNATSVAPNAAKSFAPGTYCATLEIKGIATLAPGVYVLKDGLNIAAQGQASGTGVTFYLTGPSAGFTINGGGTLNLSAPASGEYAGVLIYQDGAANVGGTNKLNGDNNTILKGAIYTPTQKLVVTGNAGFGDQNSFMPMIADTVSFSGSSVIQSDVKNTQTALPMATMSSGSRLTE